MRIVGPLLVVAFSVVISSPQAHAQIRHSESIEVKIIEIDAVVIDRDGRRVSGLTADDFELFENGREVRISNFSEICAEEVGAAAVSEEEVPATAGPRERRTVIFFIDALPLFDLDRRKVFEPLKRVAGMLAPHDRAMVVRFGNSAQTVVPMTSDRRLLLSAFDHLQGRSQEYHDLAALHQEFFDAGKEFAQQSGKEQASIDADAAIEFSKRVSSEEQRGRLRRKVAVIERLIESIGPDPGRKIVVYVSNEFPAKTGTGFSTIQLREALVRSANANGVTLHVFRAWYPAPSVSAAGGSPPPSEMQLQDEFAGLAPLSEQTGGMFAFGEKQAASFASAIEADLTSWYSVGYTAMSDGADVERRIELRTKNREWRVRARSAFVDKSDRTRAKEALVRALFDEAEAGDIPVEVSAGSVRAAGRKRWKRSVEVRVPVASVQFGDGGIDSTARLTFFVVSANGVDEVTRVKEESIRVPPPPPLASHITHIVYTLELQLDAKGSATSVAVFDERSRLFGVRAFQSRPEP